MEREKWEGKLIGPTPRESFWAWRAPAAKLDAFRIFPHILQERNIQTSYFTPFQKAGRGRGKTLGNGGKGEREIIFYATPRFLHPKKKRREGRLQRAFFTIQKIFRKTVGSLCRQGRRNQPLVFSLSKFLVNNPLAAAAASAPKKGEQELIKN